MEQEKNAYKDRPIVAFWNKHKKEIATAGGVVGAVGVAILSIFGVKYIWNDSSFERWFKKAPLDDLKTVRGNVHSEYINHTVNDEYRESLWSLMSRLDKKISDLEWEGKTPVGPAYHREDGYNLYKPD
ncbi:MAG: hypothetical protein MR379_06160 [Clostridiales bacterium]|nr:hypothetical protein [Clostridiales bacterium]